MQHAQPISFAHEIAKHAHALVRDISRIKDWLARSNFSPLGAGALAGSSLPLTPEESAKNLGFAGIVANSIDAVLIEILLPRHYSSWRPLASISHE